MVDRAVAMLTDCLAAVRARCWRAEMQHASAIRAETAAGAACATAEAALVAAEAAWHRQMAEGFDPVLGDLLASEIRARAAALVDAEASREEAQRACRDAAAAWRAEDARRSAIETQATITRRRARRRMDERLLALLADRETLLRSAR